MGSAAAAGRRLGTLQAGRPGRGGCERARPSVPARLARVSGRLRRQAPPGNPASVLPPAELCSSGGVATAAAARIPPAGGGETRKGKKEEEEGTEATARAHSSARASTSRGSAVPALGPHAPPPPARPSRLHWPRPPRAAAPFCPARPTRLGPRHPEPPASLRRARGARRRLDAPGSRLGAPALPNSPGERRGQPGRARAGKARVTRPARRRRASGRGGASRKSKRRE